MSDIDDLLTEFDTPAQSFDPTSLAGVNNIVSNYAPNPSDFSKTYDYWANSAADKYSRGWDQLSSFGSDPFSRFKGIGNIALGAMENAGTIPAAIGEYVAGPFRRGITDAGYPTAGNLVGNTIALAPTLATPGGNIPSVSGLPRSAAMIAGELPASEMAVQGLAGKIAGNPTVDAFLTKIGARAPSSPITQAEDDLEGLVDEYVKSTTRKTTAAKDLDYRVAEDWYKKTLTGEGEAKMPPLAYPESKDVRLLHKGSPKVGEPKYARDENKQPVTMSYADQGGTPTFRTSHSPRFPQQQAPVNEYEGAFSREIAGDQQFSQMPMYPGTARALPDSAGVDANRMQDMWLPNARQGAEVDPNLLAELKLKFGGGSPQGEAANPAWMPQPTAGIRPPSQMPVPGAKPLEEPNPNVIFPQGGQPVPMSREATQNTNRLRQDLGLPTDEIEAAKVARAPLNDRQPIPEKPVTPAQAPSAVTQYGDVEVGQPYDIVVKTGGNEMRAPGGTVKELKYVNEPVVRGGKSVTEPVGYATLEDGRTVPVKLLQRTGTAQPNVQMSTPKPAMPRAQTQQPADVPTEDKTADPAFAKVQQAMAKKDPAPAQAATPKADRGGTIQAITDARNKYGARTTYSQIREFDPTATRASIDKAVKEMQKTNPRLATATNDKGDAFVYMKKGEGISDKEAGNIAKAKIFDGAYNKIFSKKKAAYLHEFDPVDIQKRHSADLSAKTVVDRVNALIKEGKIRVYPEGQPDKTLSRIAARHIKDREDFDNDFIVEKIGAKGKLDKKQVKTAVQSELKTAKTGDKTEEILALQAEFDRGDITGTEFLSALKTLEKKYKAKK